MGSELFDHPISFSIFSPSSGGGVFWDLPVGVAVLAGRGTVSSPTGVRDTSMRLEGLGHVICALIDEFLQLGHLADFLECADFIFLVAIDGQTSRVVATVFQPGEAWGNNGEQKAKIIESHLATHH